VGFLLPLIYNKQMGIETNIDVTKRALLFKRKQLDEAVQAASRSVGSLTTRTMKQQIVGAHLIGTSRRAGENRGIVAGKPSNVTGNLRRSIRSKTRQTGFGKYTVVTGAYMVYARSLEFGNPLWHTNARYPFVEPTAKLMSENDKARNQYIKAMRRALTKRGVS